MKLFENETIFFYLAALMSSFFALNVYFESIFLCTCSAVTFDRCLRMLVTFSCCTVVVCICIREEKRRRGGGRGGEVKVTSLSMDTGGHGSLARPPYKQVLRRSLLLKP